MSRGLGSASEGTRRPRKIVWWGAQDGIPLELDDVDERSEKLQPSLCGVESVAQHVAQPQVSDYGSGAPPCDPLIIKAILAACMWLDP
jgi:hypothetical protein